MPRWSALDVTEPRAAATEKERLIRKLEDQNAELERFVYTVSHDLKSPLITVKGFLGHLGKAARDGNWDRFDADLARVGQAAEKMRHLLDDLLQLSRVGRVANPPRDVSVAAVAAEAVQLLAGPIAARGVGVEVSPNLPEVRADPTRLTEVLVNLIGNAVKFMGNQTRPRVGVGFRAADGAFYVSDNGIGIDPAYHARVFTRFERLDPAAEGTGVGLAIVKRIVEVHGGRVGLVLTDLVMPRLGGLGVVAKARVKWPGVPALVMSGYPDLPAGEPSVAMLRKPFTPAGLARKVREVLDQK